ncbi:MBL fold metallo-hydrolase [Baaleninema sp.]|uniref:MBL fold metallo-hydrolase n=1 Tax=Baaleninema sp. TaxID=3101197 RepID=UPI003D012676
MKLTYLDSNSWSIEMGGVHVLLDPWLVGPLVFGNLPWLFKGTRRKSKAIPPQIDAILLSQGLEDHAHPPTLEQLDRSLPVVGSSGAAKVAEKLGYSDVTALSHRQIYTVGDRLQIQAVPGSPIGPTTVENGYLLTDLKTRTRLYYEPHGYHDEMLKDIGSVEVVVTPLVNLVLPIVGPFIKGQESALEVVKWLQPRYILPTAAGGDVDFEGLLVSALRAVGSLDSFRALLEQNNLDSEVIDPTPGVPVELSFPAVMG